MKEYSFGVVPLRQKSGIWEVFLIQHQAGHWNMPKGHVEGLEVPLATAKRELFEETHLSVQKILLEEPLFEHYEFRRDGHFIQKSVGYFIAEVTGDVLLQEKEIKDGKWMLLSTAHERATFPQAKAILQKVSKMIFALTTEELQ